MLAGIALPASLSGAEQDAAWEGFLTTVGYTYVEETRNAAAVFVQ